MRNSILLYRFLIKGEGQVEHVTYQIDQQYLLHDQYKSASNLNARIQLHQRFGRSTVDWFRWVFDQYRIAPDSKILELGCGPALLWQKNLDRVADDWDIVLSDFSPGMLQEAQKNLDHSGKNFNFQVIDAQSLPFADSHFDIVIANHMLYHVPDRARALAEVRRVLKPGGYFYATTNGEGNHQDITRLKLQVGITTPNSVASAPFSLENGVEQLGYQFAHIEMQRIENELVVTEAEPLMLFILSTMAKGEDAEKLQKLRSLIEQEIDQKGAIRIKRDSGMFVAYGTKEN
jgi:ubiquinone/menaquinone biosynthesis C-methylase UbiE